MKFAKIAWDDISSIFRNRIIRVSVVAIIIVPLLYSLLYLAAFWDPYSRLDKLPVAVVNLDEGATNDNKNVNYGQDIVEKLKDNKEVKWTFVSMKEAQSGLEGDKYYSIFVIPEDFSKKIVSAKDGVPQVASIKYSANEKRNFLAAQIGGRVEDKIKAEILANISKEYTKVTFDNLYELKDGMNKASDGSIDLHEGIAKLGDNVPKLADGVQQLADGSGQLKDGLSQLGLQTPTLREAITKLFNGSGTLTTGLGQLNDKVSSISGGVSQLSDGTNKLYGAYSTQIMPGLAQLKDGAAILSNGLSKAKPGADMLSAAVTGDGTASNPGLINGAKGLEEGSKKLSDGVSSLNFGVKQLVDGTDPLIQASSQISQKYGELVVGFGEINNGVSALISGVNNAQTGLGEIGASMKAYLTANPSAATDPNIQKILATLTTLQQSSDPSAITKLQQGMTVYSAGLSEFKTQGIDQYTTNVKNYAGGFKQAISGINQLQQGATAFTQGATSYSTGANKFAQGANQIASGIQGAVVGASQISDGLNALYDNMVESNPKGFGTGLKAVNSGLVQFNENVPALVGGVNQLLNGSSQITSGLSQVNDKVPALINGVNQLSDGSVKLNSGLVELNSKMPELKDGATKLNDGSKELADKLKEGSDKLNNNLKNSSEVMGEFVSQPITIDNEAINAVKDYGTGFTPYFIPLSLWVGAIMMFFVISSKIEEGVNAGPVARVIGKYLSYGFIGTLQAVLVSAVVLTLGLKPNNILMYFAFNILMSLSFIAIIQALIFILGDAGRLLAIVLLILQLTSCAGTFPLELVPKFFKVLNPFMPFTYSVAGLREAISGTDFSIIASSATVLAIVGIVFLIISVLLYERGVKFQQRVEAKKESAVA